MPTLRQILGEKSIIAPGDLLDVEVLAIKLNTGAPCSAHDEVFEKWPGPEQKVTQWFVLQNDKAVGISGESGNETDFFVINYSLLAKTP